MSDHRGESQTSFASQSQYTESTVINQDFAEPELFASDLSLKGYGKSVNFADSSPLLRPERSQTIEDMRKRALRGDQKGMASNLLARLIDKPEHSQVLQITRPPIKKAPSEVVPQPTKIPSHQSPLIPRPPSGKGSSGIGSFRTTLYKRDYDRRQAQLKSKQHIQEEPKLTVGMLHKSKIPEPPQSVVSENSEESETAEDMDLFPELVELMGLPTETETARQPVGDDMGVTPEDEKLADDRTVTFIKSQATTAVEGETNESPPVTTRVDTAITEEDIMRVSGEIPIIEKRERPHSGRPTSGRLTSGISQPVASPKMTEENISQKKISVRVKSASRIQDPGLVLSYKKKNIYDDNLPENDDAMYHLKKFREALGWQTEIHRHAPGCRAAMEKMAEEEAVGTRLPDTGEFLYCLLRNRKNKRALYDPYDLQVVSPNEARAETIYYTISASYVTKTFSLQPIADGQTRYPLCCLWSVELWDLTVSGHANKGRRKRLPPHLNTQVPSCTILENGKQESSNTPVFWWLWERRLFYFINKIPVFVKFRKWKTFKMWKKNIRLLKSNKSQVVLYQTLFVANEVLQGCLIHVRSMCEAASSSSNGIGTGDSAISLVKLDKSLTLTLDTFKALQREQGECALKQLQALRDKVIEIVFESCATVAEMEGITQGIRPDGSKKVKIKAPPVPQKEQVNAVNKMHKKYGIAPMIDKKKDDKKSDRPLYAEIAEWRKILQRLASFLRSVDYLVVEMLRRLVVTATRHLLQHLVDSYNVKDEEEETESNQKCSPKGKSRSATRSSVTTPGKDYQESIISESSAATINMSKTAESRSLSRVSNSMLKVQQPTLDVTASGYVIPHYDFEQPDIHEGPPDIDEVLNEIRQQDIVEEFSCPVFSLQLVLTIPSESTELMTKTSSRTIQMQSASSSLLKKTILGQGSASTKKTVKFPDEPAISDEEAVSEGEESGYSEGESESSGEESENGGEITGEEDEARETDEEEGGKKAGRDMYAYGGKKGKTIEKAHVKLSPNEEDFKMGIKEVIAGFENTIAKWGAMAREPRLAVFCSPPIHDLKLNFDDEEMAEKLESLGPWPDLDFIFGDDPEYQSLLAELNTYMTMEMELVKQYSKNYDEFCVMVDKCCLLNVEASIARRPWSTDDFNHVLATHTEMSRQMKKMTLMRRIAMIQVQSRNFRDSCLPYPENIVSEVNKILPVIANKRNEDLLTIIKGASRKLDLYPASVEQFVEHLAFLSKMTTEMPALDKEFVIVNKMFTIAKDYTISIHPEELALFQTLGPGFQHLKSTILYCEAKKDENIRKFSHDLDSLIYRIVTKLLELKGRVRDPELLHPDCMAVSALETIRILQEEVQEFSAKARSYGTYQERFGSSLSSSKKNLIGEEYQYMMVDKRDDRSAKEIQADLSDIERDLTLRRLLWQSQVEWSKLIEEWTATSFEALNVEILQKNVNRFTQTVYMLEKGLPSNEVVPRLKEMVMGFKQGMPVITSLSNPSLRQRHWEQIERLIGKPIGKDKSFTLGNLLEMNIFKHKEKIQDISTTASNEATLEVMLQKIIDIWQNTDFRLVAHSGRDTYIIASADDIMAQLEESQVTIGTILGSRYVAPIKAQVMDWDRKLQGFSITLEEWLTCQRNWLYLEQIFSAPDIQRQLPADFKMFMQVDRTWKDIMRRVEDRPNALKSALASGTLDTFRSNNEILEKIQKGLEDYLEKKRLVFPRFYFLSNDELLEILAQSKDPNAVQQHLGKCFGNIKALEIRNLPRQPATVRSMMSAEGEVIQMPRNVRAKAAVEEWLTGVESGMFETVKKHLKLGLADWQGLEHADWVLKHPGQVVLTVVQIMFNKNIVKCFEQADPTKSLIKVEERMKDSLYKLAGLVSVPNLLGYQRMSIEALLTINVHNRDIVNDMIKDKVVKVDDFEWTKQLRYEWDEYTNNCQVLQSNASFQYGYEYLGCSSRLVITPLTDRCYLTLTGALHLHLGGSPAGPAGTGKTETVKDLAKAMGKQCVVFNCSEGLDYKTLGKFFSGLAQSGSWCCFDEFNRIDVEVLSVVAQQIHTIKAAKDSNTLRFIFEGRDIKLNMTCGYFITMNPTYAGRVELPDNLKYLFRQVAMMVPDYALIAEIMLFSEGFRAAKLLSGKIVNLYQLASRQLSQQDHYDFGMRAIKSVLVMAGHGRQAAQQRADGSIVELTEKDEAHILIHSLRDANMPKFLAEDVPLFESILADLFPGISPPDVSHGVLEKAVNMAVRDQNLQIWPSQIEKVKQFYKQILVRHGVMLVGPTGGGKSTVRNILQKALVLMPTIQPQDHTAEEGGKKHHQYVHNRAKKGHVEVFTINPKCVKLGELYGATDPNTFEWTDGLIATATRKFTKELEQTAFQGEDGTRPNTAVTAMSDFTRPVEDESGLPHLHEPSSMNYKSEAGETNPGTMAPGGISSRDKAGEKKDFHDSDSTSDWRWLVLDGPVDTLWVENLNTVLDDSKVLCLASGERIGLANGMRLIFEVDNLSQASPATISRCAMVYMDPVDLGWRPAVKTWIQKLPRDMPDSGKHHLQALFDYSIDKGLKFIKKHITFEMLAAPERTMISCLCHIMSAFFDFMQKHGGFGSPDKEESIHQDSVDMRSESRGSSRSSSRTSRHSRRRKAMKKQSKKKEEMETIEEQSIKSSHVSSSSDTKQYYLQKQPGQLVNLLGKLFVFAYTWAIGGNLRRQEDMDEDETVNRRGADKLDKDINICNEFDNFLREMFDVEPPLGVRLPTGNRSMYGYFIDMESGNFVPWDALVPSTKKLIEKGAVITIGETMGVSPTESGKSQAEEANITPTVDIIRFSFLTGLLLINKHPVLLTGESGVGKTAIMNHMLKALSKDGGTSTKQGTILGDILNYSEKSSSLLENISNLTKWGNEDEGTNMDMILGTVRPKQSTGIISTMIQFSAQTSAARLQAQIVLKLIKKGKDTLGAPKGRKVVVFVDDLNMPAPEEYGAQPPLELLRQFLELNGFYDTKTLVWKDILDVTVVAACGPTGGGRNPVSSRLLKNFCMFALPQPSTRSLQHIYQVQLGRFFQDRNFSSEVTECLFPLVSAGIAVYYRMCSSMLPTPAKSHYTFNVRDLSKIFQGLIQAHEGVIISKDNVAQLFAHEATRVFHDRLVSLEDRKLFFQFLSDNLHDYFKVQWPAEKLMDEQVAFGDFFDLENEKSSRVYRPMTDKRKLAQTLEEFYMRMNFGNTKTSQMVFFKDAVEHIVRAARIFGQPGGHMLLVGLDGNGKSTVAQLSSFIAGCELFKLTLHRGYSTNDFRDDLKKVFLSAGVQGDSIVFLLTDSDIVKESFLEDINCILNSGEVPDLFDQEEQDGIMMDLKQAAGQADIPDTRVAIYQFFISRVRKNLHVVLTMSPAGGKFRQRCRMNPALINCCTIDWYDEWDDEAMLSVAQVFFESAEFIADKDTDIGELKKHVGQVCVNIHETIHKMSTKYWAEMRRHYYSTPSSYMEFIKLYSRLLKENKTAFMENKNRLLNGLFRLSEANTFVATMKEELVTLGPKIEEKQKDTEVLLEQLQKDTEAVNQVRAIVENEEEIMKKEAKIVQDYANECQMDLASVMPALQNAILSLETLDKASISEIRVYNNPPVLVANVMAAVCLLFQKKPDWPTAKMMLGDPNFLKKLLQFDKNSLPDKVFHKLKKYSRIPDFNPEAVGKVSLACRSMCEWVLALEHYNEVYKMVKPKQKRVEEAREALELARKSLAQKQASLKKIQDHFNTLQQQYQDSVNQREALKQYKKTTELRLKRAAVLISALADEKVRWAEAVNELDFKLQGLVGDTLVAAASVAYIGPLTSKYRKDLIQNWVSVCQNAKIPISKDYDLIKNTVDAHQVLIWQNEGLPRDSHSTVSAIIVKKSNKWPLIIDPQGQAVKWIKEMEGKRLKIISASDPKYMRTLEAALRVGNPMLLKDVSESLDPALRPVLMHETFRRGGHLIIKLGDTEIEFNQNFKLYMTTSMSNPHYLPAVFIQANIINFTVTFEGLQEQLLSAVVRQERPQLEKKRSELLESITNDLQLLRDMEDKSLSLLQKSEAEILDDQDLVDTLQRSKGMAAEIHDRIAQSEETEKKLSLARKRYLPVATRGATLYFVLADLSGIDVMYQFSLDWFQDMFTACICGSVLIKERERTQSPTTLSGTLRRASALSLRSAMQQEKENEKEKVNVTDDSIATDTQDPLQLKKHMLDMINRLTASIYRVVSVALFSNHQLTFSFMLCTSIMRANSKYEDITTLGGITDFEWMVFLQGNILASMMDEKTAAKHDGLSPMERLESQAQMGDPTSSKHKGPSQWVLDPIWRQCQFLEENLDAFANLCRSMVSNHTQWDYFHMCDNPYTIMEKPFTAAEIRKDGETSEYGITFPWEKLSLFERLILIRVLHSDMLTASATQFIEDKLGEKYLSTGQFDLKEIYEESTAKTPLIFILSPGCDPAAQMLRFARELRGSTLHLDMISLGRGQGQKAEELISKAQILKGRWVFLANCHLAASWMPKLQTVVENLNRPNDEIDPQFRLWLSSKPDPSFPISILQTGMKMTIEPPQGLKSNMIRCFGRGGTGVVTEKLYEEGAKGTTWNKLLFGLCLFNSVIHERKKYGALGWNIAYEFNDSDLEVSIQQLQMLLTEHSEIPWMALRYLIGEVSYGGRVTDEWDRRCLHTLLSKFFCTEALEPDYSYSPDKLYQPVKDDFTFNDVVKYIESLPNYDSPELFGMTENAEKACREAQASYLIETIISVQPRLSMGMMGSEKSSDDIVADIAADILNKLPETVEELTQPVDTPRNWQAQMPSLSLKSILMRDLPQIKDKEKERLMHSAVDAVLGNSALITVLRQEIDRFNNLLHLIKPSLRSLILAIKGEVIMSETLEEAYNALLEQKVPQRWKNAAYESRKPLGSWITDLCMRVDFFSLWAELIINNVERLMKPVQAQKGGTTPEEEPKEGLRSQPYSFWLSGFFFPQGFLTGVLQNHARKAEIPVDSLHFNFHVISGPEDTVEHLSDLKFKASIKQTAFKDLTPPEDGVLVFGLFLDGSQWDPNAHSLTDSLPGCRFSHLPQIHFRPVQASSADTANDKKEDNEKQVYECPLYRTSERAGTLSSTGHSTNFVTTVNLPSDLPPSFWIMRGVALLCQPDE